MANALYNSFKKYIMDGTIDLDTHDIRVALVSSAYNPDIDADTEWADVSVNEVSGTGYTAGGALLTGAVCSIDTTDDEGVFNGSDVTWQTSTITARYAVLYDSTTVSNLLIGYYDFGSDQTSASGDFKITWNAEGLINLN